jgi:hypothetical protein
VKATAQHDFVHRSHKERLLKIGRLMKIYMLIEAWNRLSEGVVKEWWDLENTGCQDPESPFIID